MPKILVSSCLFARYPLYLRYPLPLFLSLEISLHFIEFYINVHCLILCGWFHLLSKMILRFIHAIACILVYSYLLVSSILLYGYIKSCLSCVLGIWVFSSSDLTQMKWLWTFVYKYLWGHMFLFLLSEYLAMEWLGMTGTFITSIETVKWFSIVFNWTEVKWNVFYLTTLNFPWTYPIRLLCPTHFGFLAKDIQALNASNLKFGPHVLSHFTH